MKDFDQATDYDSLHNQDYDQLLEHIIGDDHELLRLDAIMHEIFGRDDTSIE